VIHQLHINEQIRCMVYQYLFIFIIPVGSFPRVSGGSSTTKHDPFSFFILSNLIIWSTDVKLKKQMDDQKQFNEQYIYLQRHRHLQLQ